MADDERRQAGRAMFVWSIVHGLARILQGDVVAHLGLEGEARRAVPDHVMTMVDRALEWV